MKQGIDQILDQLPPIIRKIPNFEKYLQSSGIEADTKWKMLKDIIDQLNPYTATWALSYWENLVGLDNSGRPIQFRRGMVIAMIARAHGMPRKKFINLIADYNNDPNTNVIELFSEYELQIETTINYEEISMQDFMDFVSLIIPAHLGWHLRQMIEPDAPTDMYVGEVIDNITERVWCTTQPAPATRKTRTRKKKETI